ncbi:hypothetical protein Q5H93_03430 [Hymenobacter sp. ASUV-10]|uniref:SMI1/KNR4 family protein n=1 Tax=Hymenobacter aranciens TaxID=3063996 RepID=A0ABT9B6C2_9BACT|nr:hypothetical protein [Hymenobacter sp. ASUV-10]MDO7873770.1 hypothetical protein [Hymenobacter sp. ASUV-10]
MENEFSGKLSYRQLGDELVDNVDRFATILRIRSSAPATRKDTAKVKPPEWIPAAMRDYGAHLNGLLLSWESKGSVKVTGHIDLLPLDRIYQSWQGIVYTGEGAFEDPRLPEFRPVDRRGDETAVGLLHNAQASPALYLLEFGETPYPLGLDIRGYFTLLTHTLGLSYWTNMVAELARQPAPVAEDYQPQGPEARRFAAELPYLAPALDLPTFIRYYNQVRLPQ